MRRISESNKTDSRSKDNRPDSWAQVREDSWRRQMALERLRQEQSLGAGLSAGLVAALVGGILWALITVVTGYQIGWVAAGIGFLVGLAVRHFGKGVDPAFGYMGAFLALMGCAFGNFLSICVLLSRQRGIPLMELLSSLDMADMMELMAQGFRLGDLVFYAIAAYEGYKLSLRKLSDEELGKTLIPSSENHPSST